MEKTTPGPDGKRTAEEPPVPGGEIFTGPLARGRLIGTGAGFFAILLALGFVGIALDYNYRAIDGRVDQIVSVEEPISAAAHEMEINVLGAGLGVLRYVETGAPEHRARVVKDGNDFARFKAEYDRLATTTQQLEFGVRIASLHERYSKIDDLLRWRRSAGANRDQF